MNKGILNTWHILWRCAAVCFPENTLSMSEHNKAHSIRLISHGGFDSSTLVYTVSFQVCDWWQSICFPSGGIWGLHILPSVSQNEGGSAWGDGYASVGRRVCGRNMNAQEWDLTSVLPQGATKQERTRKAIPCSFISHVLDISTILFKEQMGIRLKKRRRVWTCGSAAPDFTVLYKCLISDSLKEALLWCLCNISFKSF